MARSPSCDRAGATHGQVALSGAKCPSSQDSRATHRGSLLSELSARGHAAAFEPRTLAANLGGMCDDTGGGGVSLLRASLCGGNVRHGLACGTPPPWNPDGAAGWLQGRRLLQHTPEPAQQGQAAGSLPPQRCELPPCSRPSGDATARRGAKAPVRTTPGLVWARDATAAHEACERG